MRLKSLILSGFKSFPKRTVIKFSKGVSAIVGPNGSGKSNVVDAIRWVLGEQNPRLLRAERMEELLFSGDEKFGVDCARVKLRLEECQDMAPPELKDFSDIEIERILFRDGGSKFLLNGKNCRLKEIRYLFLDTGTGARAYSIIDQGRVGQFVSMTPEERRIIVEEAAGIARYRERRIQALSKMKTTQENLDRLDDVISEVKRQRNALKRQARKAERFSDLRKQEDRLGLLIIKRRYLSLVSKENELEKALFAENEKHAALKALIGKAGLDMERLDIELEGLFDRQKEFRKRADSLKREGDKIGKEMAELEKGLALLSQEMEAARRELGDIKGRIRNTKTRISSIRGQIEKDRESISRISKSVEMISKRAGEQGTRLLNLKRKREEIKDRFVVVASKRAQVSERLGSARAKKSLLQERLERMEQKLKDLQEESRVLRQETTLLEDELSAVVQELSERERLLEDLSEKISEVKARLEKTLEEKRRCHSKITEKKARLNVVKGLEAQGSGLLAGTRALLDGVGKGARLVVDVMEVADGYEGLVERALGITLQSLVVKDEDMLTGIIESILDGKGIDSAAVLLCDENSEKEDVKPGFKNPPSGAEWLSGKILGEDIVSKKIRQILGSWLVIDQIGDLFSSSKSISLLRDSSLYVISKDGFIFTPWKELRYASMEASKGAGLISRKKEIRAIEDALKRLEHKYFEISKGEKKLIKKRTDLLKAYDAEKREKEALLEKRQRLEKRLFEKSSRLDGITDRIELLEFEQDETRDELYDFSPDIEGLQKELMEAEQEEEGLKSRLKEVEEALGEQELEVRRIDKEKNELLFKKQAIRERLRGAERELARLEKGLLGLKKSFEQNSKKLEELSERSLALSKVLQAKRDAFSEKKDQLKEIENEALLLDEEIDTKRQKRLLVEKKRAELQGDLSRITDEINRLHIKLSELRRNREHLADLCLSKFRRDIKEVLEDSTLKSSAELSILEEELREISRKIESFGPVNLMAMEEFRNLNERLNFLLGQREDVERSLKDIKDAIDRIDRECRQKFKASLKVINGSLAKVFPLLFEGGRAWLSLLDEKNVLESGVEYTIHLPGKKIASLSLLSGGEKALCALALIFAIFMVKPTPFCLLDEVDAPLDESNTEKFNSLVRQISTSSQVILVTHNQQVMEMADTLYGVTMEEEGISKLVTVEMI